MLSKITYLAVILITVMATSCTKESAPQPVKESVKSLMDHGGQTRPQLPPRKIVE